jgi:hypothetical protein
MAEKMALTTTGVLALTLPDYIAKATTAPENIGREDVRLARIGLAQPLSPELDSSSEKYITGLKSGDLFNSVTGEVFEQPVRVVIARVEKLRHVEFNPIEEGGGIKDRNVPAGDPRTQWGPDGEKPVATAFREYAAFLADRLEPIGLSFKGASLRTAVDLNTIIDMRWKAQKAPVYATIFALTSAKGPKSGFNYQVLKATPVGNTSEEQAHFAQAYQEGLSVVVIDAEVTTSEEAPF